LVHTIQHFHQSPSAAVQAVESVGEVLQPAVAATIFVPVKLHELKVADLPLSVRLEGVLQRRGVRLLGDLHGIAIRDLRGTKNCGNKTISELLRLIERAAAGEFDPAENLSWNPAELVRTLDALVADLPDRNKAVPPLVAESLARHFAALVSSA
jgi:hypothetical protein